MSFNSIDFIIFFPIVFIINWFLLRRCYRAQNIFLVVASYVFYGWWDLRFLGLIVFSSVLDFYCGKLISREQHPTKQKRYLYISLIGNLGVLFFFKYFGFFADTFVEAFTFFGHPINDPITLNIILPVGISFYTFQTLSYTIDVYRKQIDASEVRLIEFFAFVSFFPQLVAGPIERAKHLLPQFHKARQFTYKEASEGSRLILVGFFYKTVIADNCAGFVNPIFVNSETSSGSELLLAAALFSFQIYGDFAGYSSIAIGTSKLLGFDLMTNFRYPYLSRNIAEFWHRWHISLSTWFRDYVYIPLGGNRFTRGRTVANIFIVFLVSGLWHGANWTFVAWGALHGMLYLPLVLLDKHRGFSGAPDADRRLPSLLTVFRILLTFSFCTLSWVLFRSESVEEAFGIYSTIFSSRLWVPVSQLPCFTIALVLFVVLWEWSSRNLEYPLESFEERWSIFIRWPIYLLLTVAVYLFHVPGGEQFIYFQF